MINKLKYNIRQLKITDLPQSVMLETSHMIMPYSMLASSEELQQIIESGFGLGLFDDDKLIGKIGFTDEGEKQFMLRGMIINKRFQNKNLGNMLAQYAIDWLNKNKNVKKITLTVHPENTPAIILYLKLRFMIKRWISNKYGPGSDRLEMEKVI